MNIVKSLKWEKAGRDFWWVKPVAGGLPSYSIRKANKSSFTLVYAGNTIGVYDSCDEAMQMANEHWVATIEKCLLSDERE